MTATGPRDVAAGSPRTWVEAGPHDAPVLLLVPPLGATLETWDAVVPPLSDERRVIRFDLRGHGRSPARPAPAAIADLGRDIVAVLDEAGARRAAICGDSLGAMGAMWVAAHEPGRVESLVLCCTSARLLPSESWTARAALVRESGMEAVAVAVAGRWVTTSWAAAHSSEMARLRSMVESVDRFAYAGWCDAIARMDLRPELGSIVAPTIAVAGAQDSAIPLADLREIADGVAQGRLVTLTDAAHHPALEQPEGLAEIILAHLHHPEEIAHAS